LEIKSVMFGQVTKYSGNFLFAPKLFLSPTAMHVVYVYMQSIQHNLLRPSPPPRSTYLLNVKDFN